MDRGLGGRGLGWAGAWVDGCLGGRVLGWTGAWVDGGLGGQWPGLARPPCGPKPIEKLRFLSVLRFDLSKTPVFFIHWLTRHDQAGLEGGGLREKY